MRLIIALTVAVLCSTISAGQHWLDLTNYQLVLNEEFNYKSIYDPAMTERWMYESHHKYWSGGIELFDPAQLELRKDEEGKNILRIHATKLDTPQLYGTRLKYYKSGMINYRPVHEPNCSTLSWSTEPSPGFTYGIFEVRAKVPVGDPWSWDAWPAIWLTSYPVGEIDLLDAITANPGTTYKYGIIDWHRHPNPWNEWKQIEDTSTRYPAYFGEHIYKEGDTVRHYGANYIAKTDIHRAFIGRDDTHLYADLSMDYHDYAVAWTPEQVTFFLDGKERLTVKMGQYMNMFDCPMRLLVNLSVMGRNDGTPSGDSATDMWMDVAYVRVYQSKADKNAPYMYLPPYYLPMYVE